MEVCLEMKFSNGNKFMTTFRIKIIMIGYIYSSAFVGHRRIASPRFLVVNPKMTSFFFCYLIEMG